MLKKSVKDTLHHLLYRSPTLPVVCLSIFSLFILAQFVRVPLISSLGPTLLVASNACFLLIIALRFFWYAGGLRREPGTGAKRNLAHLGTTLLYGGLLLALLVGTVDYLRQYSAAVFQGIGQPMDLTNSKDYFSVAKGPLASTSGLPQLSVVRQILPNGQWPKGATEIALLAKDRSVLTQGTIGADGGAPLKYRGYEYHFNRALYDVMLAIKTSNGHMEFDDMIKLQPVEHPTEGYSFSSRFRGERYRWIVLFNPETKALRLVALDKKGAHVSDGVIAFQREPTKVIGGFAVQFSALSHWSELHVVRSRHMYLLGFGLLIALAGGVLRLTYRPLRVRPDSGAEGCRVCLTGKEAAFQ